MTTLTQTDNPELTLPIFHLNGNSPKTLGNEYFQALQAFSVFEEKFSNIAFHSRDYYIEEGAWDKALEQRREIRAKMNEIRQYIDAHSAHCFESLRNA